MKSWKDLLKKYPFAGKSVWLQTLISQLDKKLYKYSERIDKIPGPIEYKWEQLKAQHTTSSSDDFSEHVATGLKYLVAKNLDPIEMIPNAFNRDPAISNRIMFVNIVIYITQIS